MLGVNTRLVQKIWGRLPSNALAILKVLTTEHNLSVAAGDLQLLDGRWYVTHSGLLRLARRSRCCGILTAIDGTASRTLHSVTGYSKRQSTKPRGLKDSLAMVMPILPMCLRWSAALKCVWLRLEPSIEPCAKLTASDSAASKNSVRSQLRRSPSLRRSLQTVMLDQTAQAMASHDCGTDFAYSFASTISIQHW